MFRREQLKYYLEDILGERDGGALLMEWSESSKTSTKESNRVFFQPCGAQALGTVQYEQASTNIFHAEGQ